MERAQIRRENANFLKVQQEEKERIRKLKFMTRQEQEFNKELLEKAKQELKEGRFEQLRYIDAKTKITKME